MERICTTLRTGGMRWSVSAAGTALARTLPTSLMPTSPDHWKLWVKGSYLEMKDHLQYVMEKAVFNGADWDSLVASVAWPDDYLRPPAAIARPEGPAAEGNPDLRDADL